MKKILLAFILVAGLFLTACNGKIEGEITVNIFNEESDLVETKTIIGFEKDSKLFDVLKNNKEVIFVFEDNQIKSINAKEAEDGYNWQVYLNGILIEDLKNQAIAVDDIVDIKQESMEKITVNIYQEGKDDILLKAPVNGKSLLKDVLSLNNELKFLILDNEVISILDVNLSKGKYWQIEKNSNIVTSIHTMTVSGDDVVKFSVLEYDFYHVIVQDINSVEFSKKIYIDNKNTVFNNLKNDEDIKLVYNNGVIESVKNITLDSGYKWAMYLNEEAIGSLDNIKIKQGDTIKFVVEEVFVIDVEVSNGADIIFEKSIALKNDLNLLNTLISDSDLEFNYQDGDIKYVRSIFPKKNFKWEVLSNNQIIEDLENYEVSPKEAILIRLIYIPINVEFEVSFDDVEFRVGNTIGYQITIISGPILGAKVTSSNSDVLEVNGLYLQAKARGEVTLSVQIGDSIKALDINVAFKRYEDMTDEEYFALSPEEQDEVWEEHERYQAELRHLEVERIKEFANNLPNVATGDMELILGTTVKGVWVSWESNYPGVISSTGKVNKRTEDTVVTLVLTVWSREESFSVSKEIFVEGFVMAPLPTNNLTFAYLPPYNFEGFKEDDIKKVDVINYASGSIGAGHQLIITSPNVFSQVLKLRERGIRVVVCVQGGSWFSDPYKTIFEDMAINPETRAIFVQSVVDAIELYDFDGIDIDWEIPAPNNAPYFTALVRDLRVAFDAVNPDLIISAAVPNSNLSSNFEYSKIGEYMDFLHLMNYDLGWSERTSHNSVLYSGSNNTYLDLSVDKTVKTFTSLGFPKEKMIVGAAFYGKIFKNVFTSGNGLGVTVSGSENTAKTINYHNIKEQYLEVNPQYIRRDELAHANYYYDNINGIFISYDSVDAMKEKTQYAIDNGLGGIMFWDYNHDQTGDLLQAIYQTYPTR